MTFTSKPLFVTFQKWFVYSSSAARDHEPVVIYWCSITRSVRDENKNKVLFFFEKKKLYILIYLKICIH